MLRDIWYDNIGFLIPMSIVLRNEGYVTLAELSIILIRNGFSISMPRN